MTKEQAVQDNSKLIYKIASMFYGIPKEDLYQAGVVGLLDAYKQYHEGGDAKFSTFAYKYIFGSMYSLANKKMVKVGRENIKMYKYIESMRYNYAQELGYIPNNYELAELLNMTVETIDCVCTCALELISMDNDTENERNLYESIPNYEPLSGDDRISLYDSLEMLPKEEKRIIIDRYFKDETQQSIANKYNTTQVRVSRLEKKGLSRMRKLIDIK